MLLDKLNNSLNIEKNQSIEESYSFSEINSISSEDESGANIKLEFYLYEEEDCVVFENVGFELVKFYDDLGFDNAYIKYCDKNIKLIESLIATTGEKLEIIHFKIESRNHDTQTVLALDKVYLFSKALYISYDDKHQELKKCISNDLGFKVNEVTNTTFIIEKDIKLRLDNDYSKLENIGLELFYSNDFEDQVIKFTDQNIELILKTIKEKLFKYDLDVRIRNIDIQNINECLYIKKVKFKFTK